MARGPLGTVDRLPSGRWRARVQAGRREDGSPRVLSALCETEAEARARCAEMAALAGRDAAYARGVTLGAWWAAYRATKGRRLARATLSRYATCMEGAWLPALGDADVTSITRADVQAVLLAAPSRSEGRERKKALSAVLSEAVRQGALASNPCMGAAFEYPGDVGAADPSGVDYDSDPFGAIEGSRGVWDARTVLRAMPRLEGVGLEPVWLCMVGAGLRKEEAYALRWLDVRRVEVGGGPVTQVAVHHALTKMDGRKRTKGTRSVRIMALAEPFGERLWALRGAPEDPICTVSVQNSSERWRRMWKPLSGSKHTPRSGEGDFIRGRMLADPPIPYLPLSRMRATHETLMQEAGVLDSVNAAAHGHSQEVAYRHYQRADATEATRAVSGMLLVEGEIA